MADDGLAIHLKKATLGDIDSQAAELRSMYEIYRTMRRITRTPGDLKMDFDVRSKGRSEIQGKDVSGERLQADAAKFRILQGIKQHVVANIGDVQSFELEFDLSCRRVPDIVDDPFGGGIPGLPGGGLQGGGFQQ